MEKNNFRNVFGLILTILLFGAVVAVQAAPGDLDTTFAQGGKTRWGFGGGDDEAKAVAVQADGKLVVDGSSYFSNNTEAEFSVARYNTDGSHDASFGTGGKTFVAFGGVYTNVFAAAVKIQSDGKILVAGESENGANYDFAVVRYNSNGSLDNSYSTDGKVVVDVSGGSSDSGYGVALDSIGRAVVVGESGGLFGVVRILGNLSPTAASVTVSGRVLTPTGRGLTNAIVSLTDASGLTRTTRTTSFGYYHFEAVEVGQSYVLSVASKRYQFAPQVIALTEDLENLNFFAGRSNSKPNYEY